MSAEQQGRYEGPISYRAYQGEQDLDVIVDLVDDELSEPYNLYTYRYFLDDWCVTAQAHCIPVLKSRRLLTSPFARHRSCRPHLCFFVRTRCAGHPLSCRASDLSSGGFSH